MLPRTIWKDAMFITLGFVLLTYVLAVLAIIRAIHYRQKTALGTRGNDPSKKFLCYHRAHEKKFPYWEFVMGAFLAPFRGVLFISVLLCGFVSGMFFGFIERFIQVDESADQVNWAARCRIYTDMIIFQSMLSLVQYTVHHYEVIRPEDPATPDWFNRSVGNEDSCGYKEVSTKSANSSPSASPSPTAFIPFVEKTETPTPSDPSQTPPPSPPSFDRSGTELRYLSKKELYRERVTGKLTRRGTLVCNHISVWDSFVFGGLSTSFVAFASFVPALIKTYGRLNQLILLDLRQKNATQKTKDAIADHQQRAETAPMRTAPLTLFPEGTSTAGRCIMPFKDGAFLSMLPVQPMIMKYSVSNQRHALDTWSLATDDVLQNLLISFADFRPGKTIDVVWMPKMKPRPGDNVKKFKERVYTEMNLMLKGLQPDCLPDLPVWDRYSVPHTHKFKKMAQEYQVAIWRCKAPPLVDTIDNETPQKESEKGG